MHYSNQFGKELENLIRRASKRPPLLHKFFFDLLTEREYKDLAIRWQIVKLLEQGVPQHSIAKLLKISVATVTRGSKQMSGHPGGFRAMLKKYYPKLKTKKPSR